jgi:catechol 2,3-dioxygenase-like lactoylglutathione lyase family enzyme
MSAVLEHVNVTVSDPHRTAKMICDLFDWRIRWSGHSQMGGDSIHVGVDDNYIAIYSPGETRPASASNYATRGGLNHIGIVVSDLDATEQRVKRAGYKPFNHMDYEPGRRFYFHDDDGIEFEIVSYSS